jgi:hypothetical protein
VRRKESIAENAWRWEAVAGLLAMTTTNKEGDTNGRVAMDSDERVICSKWFDRRDMITKVELKVS